MRARLQFAGWLVALGISAALGAPCFAQGPHTNGGQNRQTNRPPSQPRQQQRPAQSQAPRQQQPAPRAQNERQNSGANRPPNANRQGTTPPNNNASRPPAPDLNRAGMVTGPSNNPNRPPSAYTPPPRRDFNNLSPQERQKVLENNRRMQNLAPAQRQELQGRAQVWNKLTPQQQNHIKNDVLPKWKQLPPDRQRAISQRLGVLKNMPESARNQHLNDPNFTRGMSEEDKATLRDLSHLHVGGAPDPPNE